MGVLGANKGRTKYFLEYQYVRTSCAETQRKGVRGFLGGQRGLDKVCYRGRPEPRLAYDAYVLACAINQRAPVLTLDSGLRERARELKLNVLEVSGR